jgi:polyvinyl alcohol dehydrogenase (cytochrome)
VTAGRFRGVAAALLAGLLALACGGSRPAPRQAASPLPAGPSASASSADSAEWPAYQGGALQGVLPGQATFPGARREPWQAPQVDGAVWASPIVAGGQVIVATENDTVYAYPAAGAASWRPTWTRHLATPVPASALQCGDVRPISGITSTPVADPSANRLYVVAFQRPASHVLYVLDLRTGQVLAQRPVDPPNESPLFEQQRGALQLANGYVYVPFGGLDGDCGRYHGWVVGMPVGGGALVQFRPPVCPNECAFWTPGGPTVAPDGDVWVASGNSDGASSAFDYGNAVMRLSPALQLEDWFAPSNWHSLSQQDLDLGSTRPVLLPGGLAFISGKASTGYLLRQTQLGHVSGGAFSGQTCASFAAAVASGDDVYLACWNPAQVLALTVNPSAPSFSSRWTHGVGLPGGLIEAFGAVWVVDTGGGQLEALDPATGAVRFSTSGGAVPHFTTPAAAAGHVFAVMGGHLIAVAA